ncbi:hypothetical protein C0Q70_11168 [Pomacea canaliculata]|uniref:Uncharacterized protein n=1 Tax=Pomacea canaliculata TaxID=400727 RepID=A0A2T7P577_POMCA|nr:hypothetical protein C0Q70_11168 [Pomacea canaliculata]
MERPVLETAQPRTCLHYKALEGTDLVSSDQGADANREYMSLPTLVVKTFFSSLRLQLLSVDTCIPRGLCNCWGIFACCPLSASTTDTSTADTSTTTTTTPDTSNANTTYTSTTDPSTTNTTTPDTSNTSTTYTSTPDKTTPTPAPRHQHHRHQHHRHQHHRHQHRPSQLPMKN